LEGDTTNLVPGSLLSASLVIERKEAEERESGKGWGTAIYVIIWVCDSVKGIVFRQFSLGWGIEISFGPQ